MDKKQLKNILQFIHESEGLKRLLRHSWLSNGRRESVAEHSWRMALMVMVLGSSLRKNVNLERTLKIVIVHDLAEIYAGDHWAFKGKLDGKYDQEKAGLIKITRKLPQKLATEILALWEGYVACQTEESKLAKAVDKLEVLIQHNEAKLKTWNKKERGFNFVYGQEYHQYDPIIKMLRELVDQETAQKLKKGL